MEQYAAVLAGVKTTQSLLQNVGLTSQGPRVLVENSKDIEYNDVRENFPSLGFGTSHKKTFAMARPVIADSLYLSLSVSVRKTSTDGSSLNCTGGTELADGTYLLKQYGTAGATRQTKPSSMLGSALVQSSDAKYFILDMVGSIDSLRFSVNSGFANEPLSFDYQKQLNLRTALGDKHLDLSKRGVKTYDSFSRIPSISKRNISLLSSNSMEEITLSAGTPEIMTFLIPVRTQFNRSSLMFLPEDILNMEILFKPHSQLVASCIRTSPNAVYTAADLPTTTTFTMTGLELFWRELDGQGMLSRYYNELASTLLPSKMFVYNYPNVLASYTPSTSITNISLNRTQQKMQARWLLGFAFVHPELRADSGTPIYAQDRCRSAAGVCEGFASLPDGITLKLRNSISNQNYDLNNVQFSKGGSEGAHRSYEAFKVMANMPDLCYDTWIDVWPCICVSEDWLRDGATFIEPNTIGTNVTLTVNGSIPAEPSPRTDVRYYVVSVTQERFITKGPKEQWLGSYYMNPPPDITDGGELELNQMIGAVLGGGSF